ncbi:acyl-CoA dehydrogenase family protein [Aeromicrobium terrae]|uniref:Acyl-CoA dehydrogenase n=1 Tax=Aeromicrobium terrae TaxID=2498846 RepID=A0A5C8NJZ9_9ACTN|nr:acyl-CoA dehydrogenase [Aeromicrobium terrae]TXL60773.1 acyl-CoA dehydrogenase [Aeromicrobium terrae]
MDFTFSSDAEDAASLAATILADHTKPERLAEVEAGGNRFDPVLWKAITDAFDGAELGFIELCRVLVEVGRTVAPIPLATDGVARLFLAEHDLTPDAGILSCAISEEHDYAPSVPTTTVARDGDEVVVTGTKYLVPAATVADAFLVTAASPDGSVVVRLDASEVQVREQKLSDGDTVGLLEIDARVPADRLVPDGNRLVALATVATCAVQLGVVEGAVRLTSEYAKTREQFDRPIGTFQAVAQRLADGYIDMRMQALTVWQAAWRLSEGLPAEEAVATAKLWAADAGHRVAHTTVHVHGGVGIDLDGEAHRYFTAAKRYELEHGSATDQALRLGRLLAAGPA